MVVGGDYGFTVLGRKKCDFVNDLGSEKRETGEREEYEKEDEKKR